VLRPLLFLAAVAVAAGAFAAGINRAIDPANQFYSRSPLTAALRPGCLLGDDAVGERSHVEFKADLAGRRRAKAVLLGSNGVLAFGARDDETSFVNLGFPELGPAALLEILRALDAHARLTVYVATELAWFDPRAPRTTFSKSLASDARYLLSPWTLKSSLSLLRRSRSLAFKGWEKEPAGGTCVVDRGSPFPGWRSDGTLVGPPARVPPATTTDAFAFDRLTPVDDALAFAQRKGWRLVGFSPPEQTRAPASLWDVYRHELPALFAKHGFSWLDRSEARAVYWPRLRGKLDAAARS